MSVIKKNKIEMTSLRKAWSLTEMIVIMFLFAVLMSLITRPTKTIIQRIPHIQIDIQTNRVLLSVLNSIRKDVANATEIEISVKEIPAEIQTMEQVPSVDINIDANTVPVPAPVPAEPNEPTKMELSTPDLPYFSTYALSDSNSKIIDEVVNDVNLLIMPAATDDTNTEPINTMTTLSIKTDSKMIRYEFANGIAKRITTPAEMGSEDLYNSWHIPKVRLDMQVWRANEKAYALEITNCIVRRINGRDRDTMSNSHVFFVKEQSR